MNSSDTDLIAEFDNVTRVVADPLRFKARLAIGEDAYRSLQATRVLGDIWQVGTAAAAGGAVAGSSAVAGTFFGGWLTALGVATAVTPVGWVLGAAAASGAACYGVVRLFRSYEGSRIIKVPAFINTPIDFLAASLFDLMATLAIRVAEEAEELDADERNCILSYFTEEWGLDPDYVEAALPVIEQNASVRALEEIAGDLALFKKENPDCNFAAMKTELIDFLTEIAEADGSMDETEEAAIARISRVLETAGGRIGKSWTKTITAAPSKLWAQLPKTRNTSTPADDRAESEGKKATGLEFTLDELPLPVVWLLGKTGAGKTSLIQAITGATEAAVGNGFEPCTRTAAAYDFPPNVPLLRFLDSRGLGEAHYDPTDDLAVCQAGSHVLLIFARLDDPVQSAVSETLAALRKQRAAMPIILIHTAGDRIADPEARRRAQAVTQSGFEEAWGEPIPSLNLVLSDPQEANLEALCEKLVDVLPSVALFLDHQVAKDEEEAAFQLRRSTILRYAGSVATTGAVPMVGAASVPAMQIAMLATLASGYGIKWDRSQLALFGTALGGGVLGGQAVGLLGRQAASLIPVVGQIVVPALSASWGFASTYALGRAAAYWMHQTSRGKPVDHAVLHQRYAQAFRRTTTDAAD